MADDLGYGDISPYSGWIETPSLERLAREGMRFTDFHTSGNVCSPTRAGLVTGRYQHRAGIPTVLFADPARETHFDGLGDGERTLAEVLKEDGYATAIFGKWHLGYQPEFNPIHHGFDEFRGFVSGNLDYHSHIDMMGRADWWRNAELSAEEGYATHLITEHALRFIAEHQDRPFLLYLPHHAPHFPFQGPDDPAERTIGGEFDTQGSVKDTQRAYREMVQAVDRGVGQILDALQEHGIAERTLVWFFSDNGAAQWGSNKPLRGLKGSDWEGGHRVPAIASWPGRIPAGSSSDALTSTLDVMPTVLSVAGLGADPDRPFDGLDISQVLLRHEDLPVRRLFWRGTGFAWNGAAVRDGSWKLVIDSYEQEPGPPLLFDLESDLGEQNDVAAENPERVKRMMGALDQWRDEVED